MPPQRPQHTRGSKKCRNGSHLNEEVPNLVIVPFDADRRAKFCSLIEEEGNLSRACGLIGIPRDVARVAVRDDREFRSMYEEAMDRFKARLVRAAIDRGVKGLEKPVYFKGERCDKNGENREYSDALLIKLLERHIPEFRPKSEHHNVNANVDLGAVDLRSLSPAQQLKLRALLEEEPSDDTQRALPPPADVP